MYFAWRVNVCVCLRVVLSSQLLQDVLCMFFFLFSFLRCCSYIDLREHVSNVGDEHLVCVTIHVHLDEKMY